MSQQINLPSNQIKLTNVAVVRMNRCGQRFEIACYRNKVVNFRQGLEQDLSEVLQTERIFTNVSKGQFAKAKDLEKAFGTKDEEEISKVILTKGQLQVSDKERSQQNEKTSAQVAEWISKNCVHPSSDRPYTISQIRHAMQQANFSVHPTKPLKRQYLDCVKLLHTIMPIQRAKMELALFIPKGEEGRIEDTLKEHDTTWAISPTESQGDLMQYNVLVDPSLYRVLNEAIEPIESGRIEIIMQVVTKQGDVELEMEMEYYHGEDEKVLAGSTTGVERLTLSSGGNQDDDDREVGSDSDEEEEAVASIRAQQKKARKKNKKGKRREENTTADNDDNTSSAQMENSGQTTPAGSKDSSDDRKSCNTCGGFFNSASDYRAHFRSNWHRFNQKLKLKGAAPVSEQEFLICDSETFFGEDTM
jgi:ribosome maturation protein SDO1